MLDSIFGTPNKDAANAKQAQIMFNQYSAGNNLHNKGTSGKIMKELAIMNYRKGISNQRRRVIHARGAVNKTAESVARVRARGPVNEGGRSRRFGDNNKLMLLSQMNKAENHLRYAKGEQSAMAENMALNKFRSDDARGNEMIGVGVGAKMGIRYTKDNNVMKAAKLAWNIGTGNLGGLVEDFSGKDQSVFKWLGGLG
tara:strand:- start:1135 stop:1728 length:594 start_codon:yes stop_codon:yes gene_type:complete